MLSAIPAWSRAPSSASPARCWASACTRRVVSRGRGAGSAALRACCAERLSDYKVPETMDLTLEPLPRNANGKVMKGSCARLQR